MSKKKDTLSIYGRHEEFFLGLLSIVALFLLWEWAGSTSVINPLFISYPTEIMMAAYELFSSGFIVQHFLLSAREFSLGYTLAIFLGIPLGILIAWYKRVHGLLNPIITTLYITPRAALLPLFIIWFGIGILPKIIIVFLAAFFPILINTTFGIRSIDRELIKVGQSFGASDFQIFKTIALPYTMPFILAGLRLAVGRALGAIVVAELFGGVGGIGYLLEFYGSLFETDRFMVLVIMLVIIGIALTEFIHIIEKRVGSWRNTG